MSLKEAIIVVLEVFGECKESKLFNLLTVGHEAGMFDAGLIKWGVDCFYSQKMYEELASLVSFGIVKQNGLRTFEINGYAEKDPQLLEFYIKVKELMISPYRIAWYFQAKKLHPDKVFNKLPDFERKKIDGLIKELNIART